MSEAQRIRTIETFHQESMAEAYDLMLHREWCTADAEARRSGTISAFNYAREAYYRFMRVKLSDPERRVVELENEVAKLSAENAVLRKGRRPRIPVPVWRDPPVNDDGGTPP